MQQETGSETQAEKHALSRRSVLEIMGTGIVASVIPACTRGRQAVMTTDAELTPEIYYSSTRAIAAAIRAKKVSSVEVVQAFLDRIEAVNGKLNAVVQLAGDQALAAARAADARLSRGEYLGPLHGVPMTIKDSIDTAGVVTTYGTIGRRDFVPAQDATVVARLKAAGAILMGKTNTPEFTLSFETHNKVYGVTNNPYDVSRTPGGSSGGAAAIIAAGGSPFDVGSDYGGSIRVPSHCTGIAGIKPSSRRVPRTGHAIPFGGILDDFQQLGPIARSVSDLSLLLPILAGPDWIDPYIVPMPWRDPAAVNINELRICFYTDNGVLEPTAEIADVIRSAATKMSDSGAVVTEARPTGIESSYQIVRDLWDRCDAAFTRALVEKAGTTPEETGLTWLYQLAPASDEDIADAVARAHACRSQMLSFFKDYDVILCPVNAKPAIPHQSGTPDDLRAFSYTMTYNLTGWPGAVVRGGTSPEGLPIGVQVVANPWREDVALAVALFLENELGGFQAPEI